MKAGAAWELRLEMWNRDYKYSGFADIFRCHPEAAIKAGKLIYVAKGPPDFAGFIYGGRGILFDAKETSGSRFSFALIKPHQADALSRAMRFGAFAFIAARHIDKSYRTINQYVLPWSTLEPLYNEHPSGSARFEDIGVEMHEVSGWWDCIQRLL